MPRVEVAGSNRLYVDELDITDSVVPLSSTNIDVTEILVQVPSTSASSVLFGNADKQLISVSPGQSIILPVNNPANVYVRASGSNAHVAWLARN